MSDTTHRPDSVTLHRVAHAQEGYFTTRQAHEHGFSPQLLAHHVRAGRYERVRRGMYRVRDHPGSGHEEVRAKWLAVGSERSVVSHESALELHGLSDVPPKVVHLLVARADRGLNPPRGTALHTTKSGLGHYEVVIRAGMLATAPARSIVDAAAAGLAPAQIELAVGRALERGLITRRALLASAERRGERVARLIQRAVREAGETLER